MTQWALIVDSVVYEITDISPVGRFHPSMTWVQCDGTPGVAVDWTYIGGVFAAPAVVIPTAAELAQEAYDAAVAAGVQITSTGTPALNGVYGLDQVSLSRITSEQLYANQTTMFSNGQRTRSWIDQTGAPHLFPSVGAFTAFAEAVAQYDDALIAALQAGLAGAAWAAPPPPAAIA